MCLCEVYYHSLGIISNGSTTTNGSISVDTMMCPFGDLTCKEEPGWGFPPCIWSGGNVQLYYFPPETRPSESSRSSYTTPEVVTWDSNITFTSPSVYLSFDYLAASTWRQTQWTGFTYCRGGTCEIMYNDIPTSFGSKIYNTILSTSIHLYTRYATCILHRPADQLCRLTSRSSVDSAS